MNISTLSAASTIRMRVAMSAMLIGTVLPPAAHSQMAAPVTDPVELGVMQGFPPPADKLVTKANSLRFPNLGWALRNTRMMMPTANVEHARVPMPLPAASTLDPEKVQFTVDGTTLSLSDYLRRTYTDGFIVIHDGKIVYEGYFNSYTPHQTHAWASMTKSVTGLIAAVGGREVYVPIEQVSSIGGEVLKLTSAKLDLRTKFASMRDRRSPYDGKISHETTEEFAASRVMDLPGKKAGTVASDLLYGVTLHLEGFPARNDTDQSLQAVATATQVLEPGLGEDVAAAPAAGGG